MNKLLHILLFFSMFLIASCSSSYIVSSSKGDTSVDEFNESAEGEEAEIILLDSKVFIATEVYLSADSLYWFNPETKLKSSVAKSEISKVMFTEWGRGGLEGASIGFLSGAIPGIVFGALTAGLDGTGEEGEWIVAWTLIGGVGGALIGFPIGAITGHTNEYEFRNVEQQKNSNK